MGGNRALKDSYPSLFVLILKKEASISDGGIVKQQHGILGQGEILLKLKLINGLCFPMPFLWLCNLIVKTQGMEP